MILRKILTLGILLLLPYTILADKYISLDKSDPITMSDNSIIYRGEIFTTGTHCFFIDNNIKDEDIQMPYVYNSIQKAFENITDGTPENPMRLIIAPGIYWIDNPDDDGIRRGKRGSNTPFGMVVDCENLCITGLTNEPRNVVLASNRGQMQGAIGNFTMFNFRGDNLTVENITMSNYCNVDLIFPLDSTKNRIKRSETITQSQIAFVSGKATAKNCVFVSRLNACPLVGNGPVRFYDCYIECGDDALCGSAYYENCKLGLFSSKPFYNTWGTGAIFKDCIFNLYTTGLQCFTKQGGSVAILNSRFFNHSDSIKILWSNNAEDMHSCFEYNNTLNDKPLHIGSHNEYLAQSLNKNNDEGFINISDSINTYINIKPAVSDIETEVSTSHLKLENGIWCNRAGIKETIKWSLCDDGYKYASIISADNESCVIKGTNDSDSIHTVIVKAENPYGLSAFARINVKGRTFDAPEFTAMPTLSKFKSGKINVDYEIASHNRADQSVVSWYRCTDRNGSEAIMVATSRLDTPEYTYTLNEGDEGFYIMAEVSPKHMRSHTGKSGRVISKKRVAKRDIKSKQYYTDFQNFPCEYQPMVKPGFWTLDSYKPIDTKEYEWEAYQKSSWHYGRGIDGGASGTGLQQSFKGARLMYTPVKNKTGDNYLKINIDPCKPAGQGFGTPTGQYLDICIKFDTHSLSGYGLRIERSVKYDKAVVFKLIKYKNGVTEVISEEIASNCFVSTCEIEIFTKGERLYANSHTTKSLSESSDGLIKKEVHLEAIIKENGFSGIYIQHTGSVGASAAILKELLIK